MSVVRKAKKRPFVDTVHTFICDFPDLFYDGAKVVCKVCEKYLMCWDRRDCKNHVNTREHRNRKKGLPARTDFVFDLLVMMTTCNLSLRLLDKDPFKDFWNKYNLLKLPTRKTARKHIPNVREDVEKKIESKLENQWIWLCVDDRTDCKQNSIVNVIVRVLDPHKPTCPLLLASKRLHERTGQAIASVVLDALAQFQISPWQVLMFLSNHSATMRLVAHSLQEHGCKFLHVTCKVHGLRLVAETIRQCFPEVDALITSTKKVFLKSPKRLRTFQAQCPGVRPILTRWGTWLQATLYYAKHFQQIKAVVVQFNPAEAAAIKESQVKFQDASIETDLQTINNNYKGLHGAIEKLQNSALSLTESLQILDEVGSLLRTIDGARNDRVLGKFESVLKMEPDFIALQQIRDGTSSNPLVEFKERFNYACITSVDVERSFSKYKHIFSPRRTSFNETTGETYLMLSTFYESYPVGDNSDNSENSAFAKLSNNAA